MKLRKRNNRQWEIRGETENAILFIKKTFTTAC